MRPDPLNPRLSVTARESEHDPIWHRIVLFDFLRGMGVFMILFSNIQEYALPRAGYFFPSIYRDFSRMDTVAWHIDQLFFNEKSLILFALLFGVGIVLSDSALRARDGRGTLIHFRRQGILLGLGLLHSYLLWPGDILVPLAIGGLLVYPLRRAPGRILIGACLVFQVVIPGLLGYLNSVVGIWNLEELASFHGNLFRRQGLLDEIVVQLRGGLASQMSYRVPASLEMHSFVIPYHLIWTIAGSMSLGMFTYRSGAFAFGNRGVVRFPILFLFMVLGIVLTWLEVPGVLLADAAPWAAFFLATQYNFLAAIFVLAGWIGIAGLVVQEFPHGRLVNGIATVGRMSLSNYVFQSVICTWIFFGSGLCMFGRIDRAALIVIVVLIWGLQYGVSWSWNRRFRFGPLEWIVRNFAYGSRQVLRRQPDSIQIGHFS